MKKGISPLIAAVILIAFVIVVAGIASGFFTGFFKSKQTQIEEKGGTVVECGVANLDIQEDILECANWGSLEGRWYLDEGSGTTAKDSSGNNNGMINGATWVKGIHGKALDFDGVNDYVKVPQSSSLMKNWDKTTFSAWFNSSGGSNQRTIMTSGPNRTGLVGEWRLESVNGTNYTMDTSGNGNDGELVTGGEAVSGKQVSGISGKGLDFDGSDDYVDIPEGLITANDDLTTSIWFKANDVSSQMRPLTLRGDIECISVISYGSEGDLVVYTDSWHTVLSGGGVSTDTWYLLTITYTESDNTWTAYVDGVEEASWGEDSLSYDSDNRIGSNDGGGQVFDGKIDEVRIYDRALSTQEIKSLYMKHSLALDGNDRLTYYAGNVTLNSSSVSANDWHHAAGTYSKSSGEAKLWLNGNLVDSSSKGSTLSSGPRNLWLGSWENSSYWNGRIDEVRIYSKALSSSEVKNLYSHGTHLRFPIHNKGRTSLGKKFGVTAIINGTSVSSSVTLDNSLDKAQIQTVTALENITAAGKLDKVRVASKACGSVYDSVEPSGVYC